MALGFDVTKEMLNAKVAQAALQLRNAFENIETVKLWLDNHPGGGTDPLTQEPYNFSEDEAYAMRLYFQNWNQVRADNAANFDLGRKMTGLE